MQEFEEASIGGQPQGAPTAPQDQTFQVTTDDLVYMIGEKAIGERQSNKMIAMLQQNVQYLQQECMKLQSLGASEHGELEALRQKAEAAEQRANAAESAKAAAEQAQASQMSSFQARIVALENQVYQTAQERDQAIRERDAALQSTAAFEERLDKSMSEIKSMRTTFDVLKDESNRLYAEIATLTKERDALRTELDALKSAPETHDAGTWDAPAKPRKGKK